VTLAEWIERYRRAWETGDADEVVAIFTTNASYRSSVFREPFLGSQAIRSYWQRGAGAQRNVTVRMGWPIAAAGRVAVEWWTTMTDPDEGEVTLPGCLLLRFAADGRCSDLWEYWQVQPGWREPPEGWGGLPGRPGGPSACPTWRAATPAPALQLDRTCRNPL